MFRQTPLPDATIVIVARNAAATIARAVRSAQAQKPSRIVLVDDWSSDGTSELASARDPQLVVIRPADHRTIGFARQVGLEAVRTSFGIWLDADDELLPGRLDRLTRALERERADFATDSVELVDGASGATRGVLRIPAFLRRDPRLTRLFERNYLPAPGPIGFRTESALRIGYDAELHGSEDVDFVLRSVARSVRWCLIDAIGYRQHAYPFTLSRDLANQRAMYGRCLSKHSYGEVRRLMTEAGWSPLVILWALVSMAVFREEYDQALAFVSEPFIGVDESLIVEPDGPCPLDEGWHRAFFTGTLALLTGRPHDAIAALERAESRHETAEAANNLGIARWRAGQSDRARACFERAASRWPGYVDARVNLDANVPDRITTHPLRRDATRTDYPDSPRA